MSEQGREPEVLTAEEAAELLRVSLTTVLKESRLGLIPGVKVGREWRYSRAALLRHLARYSEAAPEGDDDQPGEGAPEIPTAAR